MKKRIAALDPGTQLWADRTPANKAALTRQQKADAARVRVKLDVPPAIKETLAALASENGVSSSGLGAYLLADAMIRYIQDQPEIPVLPSRSPRVAWTVSLIDITNRLTNAAETLQCTQHQPLRDQ